MMQQELSERLLMAVQSLPPDQRNVIALYYVEGMSTEEVAEAMERPPGTIRRLMSVARNNLRAQLTEE
jgi:RNA polymerase sigma factor (sigma-70 family)